MLKYGWHGFDALNIMVEHEEKAIMRQDYTAHAVSMLVRIESAIGGHLIEYPDYFEMMYPEQKKKDTRTSDEIFDDLVAAMLGKKKG